MIIVQLLAVAGITMTAMDVVGPALLRLTGWQWLGRLISCAFCTGFHAGWAGLLVWTHLPEALTWAFAGAALGGLQARLPGGR